MRFLFVRPEVCLHLPSDSTSRWTPLVFGYVFPATGQTPDFHRLETCAAGRTRKKMPLTDSPRTKASFVLRNPFCLLRGNIAPCFTCFPRNAAALFPDPDGQSVYNRIPLADTPHKDSGAQSQAHNNNVKRDSDRSRHHTSRFRQHYP